MITVWNLHDDEYRRLSFFIGEERTSSYTWDFYPQGIKKFIVSEGSREKIPANKIKETALYPCVKDISTLKRQGFMYAFTKDKYQKDFFGENAIILPPVFGNPVVEQERTKKCCSLIHFVNERDRKAATFLKYAGVENYGFPNNPISDVEILSKTKFLVHPKTIGYLCNAVIKAMNALTPVIFTPESYCYGYQDYLTPGVDCIVVNNPTEAILSMNMSDSDYKNMQKNIADSVNRIKESYDEVKKQTLEFIEKIWKKQ